MALCERMKTLGIENTKAGRPFPHLLVIINDIPPIPIPVGTTCQTFYQVFNASAIGASFCATYGAPTPIPIKLLPPPSNAWQRQQLAIAAPPAAPQQAPAPREQEKIDD